MGSLIAAYVAVWLAVAFYVYRLDERQRRLDKDIELLKQRVEESITDHKEYTRAA
jgi:CcmD family protein